VTTCYTSGITCEWTLGLDGGSSRPSDQSTPEMEQNRAGRWVTQVNHVMNLVSRVAPGANSADPEHFGT